jgi:hypothetical protein
MKLNTSMLPRFRGLDVRLRLLSVAVLVFASASTALAAGSWRRKIIMLEKSGGFKIGGTVIIDGTNPNQTLSCNRGCIEYLSPSFPLPQPSYLLHELRSKLTPHLDTLPLEPPQNKSRPMALLHPMGRAPRRTHKLCLCPHNLLPLLPRRQQLRQLELRAPIPYLLARVQFPGLIGSGENGADLVDEGVRDQAWRGAVRKRYDELDTDENVLLHANAAAFAADSGRLGDGLVYVTNLAAGMRAQMTAILSNSTNIKGTVAYESIGYAFPASFNITGFRDRRARSLCGSPQGLQEIGES